MSSRIRFLSMRRIKIHELRSTVRILLGDDRSWPKQSSVYSKLETDATQSFLKTMGPLIVGYLIANSLRSGNQVGFTVSSVDIFAPASFFLFFLSFAFLMNAVAFNHLSTAMSAKSRLAGLIRVPGFSVNAYDVLNNGSENGLGIPNHLDQFHKGLLPVRGLLQFLFATILVSILIPLGALGFFLFNEQATLLLSTEISILERSSAAVGILAVFTAVLYVVLFHVPLPMMKHKRYIRWNFLFYLPPHPNDNKKFQRWKDDNTRRLGSSTD